MSEDPDHERNEVVDYDDERDDKAHDGSDHDTPPGAPGKSDTPLGDTDQHSDANA